VLDDDSATGDAFREIAANTANMQGIIHRKGHSEGRTVGGRADQDERVGEASRPDQ